MNVFGFFRKRLQRVGAPIRGRIHKVSIAGGEVSAVIRFGLDEPHARQLLQGSLVEVFETRAGVPSREACPLGAATHNAMIKRQEGCPGCSQ